MASSTVSFVVSEPSTGLGDSRELTLVVEYRDLADQWWEFRTPANLGYTQEGNWTYSQPTVAFRLQDAVERSIPAPTIRDVLPAKDVTIPDRASR